MSDSTTSHSSARSFSTADPGAYRYPFPAFPNGWMAVCFSDEVGAGQVLALHRFGRDIVVWRTESGKLAVADAYCPHLGAHLGFGGVVEGDDIRCPFHHWRYGSDGNCRFAPRAKRVPQRARLAMFPSAEINHLVFVWYHPGGAAPTYAIDRVPEIEEGGYREVRRHLWTVRSHPQEMMENAVDVTHFEAMHRWKAHSIDWESEGPRYRMRINVDNRSEGYQSATAENVDDVVSYNVGPGFSYTRFSGTLRAISLNIMTPAQAGIVYNPQSFWVAPDTDEATAQKWAQGFLDDYADDIPVWERKVFRLEPVLSDADGPFARYRRWYAQFYDAHAADV
jgi:phenylpropionate dioxygenase-like ring-hydroxylating dioxygenase large terminal subunit